VRTLSCSSTQSFDPVGFTNSWCAAVEDVPQATDPVKSAAVLRRLTQTKLLKYTDMRDEPEKFFLAHRLLSTVGLGGFGVRFTVSERSEREASMRPPLNLAPQLHSC
jgi:hypothetical protein